MTSPKHTFHYCITITLLPRLYKENAESQYDQTAYELKEIIKPLKDTILVAELTKNFNIHYHLYSRLPIVSRNPVKYFVDQFRKSKLFGFVNLSQCKNDENWLTYIFKSVKETYEAVGRPPIIILDDFYIKQFIENYPDLTDPCYHGYFIQ